ncbi:uncharacterized protein LOC133318698 [Danaus plexippus]|uniref:Uncharacterized protein n=1 Tax=Danaus plexippus plexippus TaxID=278856 RepID=A0A212EZ81_DANPL|nr:uncharacterized protein LOC133318698 [Danaus plexippus]OWR46808.1 hypothetical protein KGM_206156 [Danaus plexippus plexippus]
MSVRLLILGVLLLHYVSSENDQSTKPSVELTGNLIDRSSRVHDKSPNFQGFWKKKFIWRPRWVKTWQEKKIYIAVWKRMWGPAEIKEWVPVAKPPPGWIKNGNGGHFIKVGLPH